MVLDVARVGLYVVYMRADPHLTIQQAPSCEPVWLCTVMCEQCLSLSICTHVMASETLPHLKKQIGF